MESNLVRQSTFRDDGTVTSVPAKNSEQPQLEVQGSLMQWHEDQEKLKRLEDS